ncbi:Na+/H+ antiporter NhaA [Thalassotalea mangrovi]|uniref:Na(+)/H(+) antiporter NhaA n=1 Tax=Thalassotalea mangrovi TaxID=2572245 RepID=A0A4U1B9J3_9GAMM|nr:Na+/H+ antiporter NhaA [Thalassotalea mangrovi]TKB47437.1 Na+/H+ antiporter NhaA [Thalassotalea mangrovi]
MQDNSPNPIEKHFKSIHYPVSQFIRAQTTASAMLLLATLVALWWANSGYASTYQHLVHKPIGIILGDTNLQASLKHVINDGLMVIFFFMLGLEIKRELIAGDLADSQSRRMLVLCALGGMAFPALIYAALNWSQPSVVGWGIPMATDTAFALGVLMLVRKYIPTSLLAFIVGLAIVDDIGALLVIAVFYTDQISLLHFFSAVGLVLLLTMANLAGIRKPMFYILVGLFVWWFMLKSGVHATLAGVLIALTVPARPKDAPEKIINKAKDVIEEIRQDKPEIDVLSNKRHHQKVTALGEVAERASTPLRRWEDALELPVALIIVPLFALINAGIPINIAAIEESVLAPTGLGIILGLVLGKFIGISGASYLATRLNIGQLPVGMNFQHIIGVSFIAGIGFTMSTFIATLGFENQPENLLIAKMSIMLGSVVAAFLGALFLFANGKRSNKAKPASATE